MLSFLTIIAVYYTKNQHGCIWLKIFHHNGYGGSMFRDFSHALSSDEPNLYSILHKITDSYKINGKFEFLLEYPELSGYNRWKQSYHPINENDDVRPVRGYEAISISWQTEYWGGLTKSSRIGNTLIDGSCGHSYWFYSIGAYQNNEWIIAKCPSTKNCIPGPSGSVREVILWVRVTTTDIFEYTSSTKVSRKYSILWFCLFLL